MPLMWASVGGDKKEVNEKGRAASMSKVQSVAYPRRRAHNHIRQGCTYGEIVHAPNSGRERRLSMSKSEEHSDIGF
jgi:hypothetical protein